MTIHPASQPFLLGVGSTGYSDTVLVNIHIYPPASLYNALEIGDQPGVFLFMAWVNTPFSYRIPLLKFASSVSSNKW